MKYKNLKVLADKFGLILASGSPRRYDLLKEVDLNFEKIVPSVDETDNSDEQAYDYAERLAVEKALAVSSSNSSDSIVLGCDTTVVLNNKILGKPIDETDALRILSELSGHQHVVCTAVAFSRGNELLKSGYELTEVYFNKVTKEQILGYIQSGEPMDKAGAYGIQGMGAFLVDRIEGNLDNVIGLPRTLLEKFAGEIIEQLNG